MDGRGDGASLEADMKLGWRCVYAKLVECVGQEQGTKAGKGGKSCSVDLCSRVLSERMTVSLFGGWTISKDTPNVDLGERRWNLERKEMSGKGSGPRLMAHG